MSEWLTYDAIHSEYRHGREWVSRRVDLGLIRRKSDTSPYGKRRWVYHAEDVRREHMAGSSDMRRQVAMQQRERERAVRAAKNRRIPDHLRGAAMEFVAEVFEEFRDRQRQEAKRRAG